MSLEIKIPKDIRQYHESVFFGLSIRQLVCCGVALGSAVGAYFGLQNVLGQETVSWVCVLCAAPFAIAAFFSYNGMNLEKFIVAWFRSEFLCAGPRLFKTDNTYRMLLAEVERDAKRRPRRAKKPKAAKKNRKGDTKR